MTIKSVDVLNTGVLIFRSLKLRRIKPKYSYYHRMLLAVSAIREVGEFIENNNIGLERLLNFWEKFEKEHFGQDWEPVNDY